jgi:tetratricopeptide (TPR) repeat protein
VVRNTPDKLLESAVQLHQSGRLEEAESIYRQILAVQPDHPDALHLLGALALKAGHKEIAEKLIRHAIAVIPSNPIFHNSLGAVLRNSARLDEAAASFRSALALDSNFVTARGNLADTLRAGEQLQEAIDAYQRFLKMSPGSPWALAALTELLCQLGIALSDAGRLDAAIASFTQATILRPDFAPAYGALGNTLLKMNRAEEAVQMLRKASQLTPDSAPTAFNLANALRKNGQADEAIACYHKAILLQPDYYDAHFNLGNTFQENGRLAEAEISFREALRFDPDSPGANYNLGNVLLTQGRLQEGWKLYEWRDRVKDSGIVRRPLPMPLWDGTDLRGRSILLFTEQGFGDSIQFIRYLPMIRQMGAKVFAACYPQLEQLFRGQFDVDQWLSDQAIPSADFYSPLPSLPGIFGTTLQTIPANIPYLFADATLRERWKNRLAAVDGLKVGIVWSGRPEYRNNINRSLALSRLAPLAKVRDIRFFSLQKGIAAQQIQICRAEIELMDWTDELANFADTAALIANLDLIITVDTAVAHLSAAIGKPTWVLLQFVPDWRWLLDRDDSPWYPTMRLFRQIEKGNWENPIRRIADALRGKTQI